MAQSYAALQKQIAALQAEASKLKEAEVAGVVAKIKEAIEAYELTPQHLFGPKAGKAVKAKSKSKTKLSLTAKYTDSKGGEWGGRGPRPQWLRDALAAGKKLEDFAVGKAGAAPESEAQPAAEKGAAKKAVAKKASARKPAKKASAEKKAAKAKFSDGAGNSWTGFGPQPKWLKEAIAGGKTLEDFKV